MKCVILLLCVTAASGLAVPQSLRKKRDTNAQDQQADNSLLLYSAVPSSVGVSSLGVSPITVSNLGVSSLGLSTIHSPFLWRKKRDTSDQDQDQQADPSLLMYSTMPTAVSNLGISPISISSLGIPIIHNPFILRKKRDTGVQDQQADPSLLMYSAVPSAVDVSNLGLKTIPISSVGVNPLGLSTIHSPFIFRKKRDVADQQAEDSMILYTVPMPLATNIWGNTALTMMPLKK